jgi:DNA-binding LacI/PurR family transcriptional regulator
LQTLLTQRGYRVATHVCRGEYNQPAADLHAAVMSNLRLQSPQGIICSTADLAADSKDALRELQLYCEGGGFAVTYDAPTSLDIGCDQVLFDREHNTYTATRHLLELGHRQIVFYGGWDTPAPQRLQGYVRALSEFGLSAQSDWILPGHEISAQSPHLAAPNFNEESGARLAEMFLALQPRPTAACITNDAVAVAFITGLLRRGVRVPEEVSVIGQDNLPVGEYSSFVPLTTVSQPAKEITEHVVELMMQRIHGEISGPPRHITLTGDLVLRNSTAPPSSRNSAA